MLPFILYIATGLVTALHVYVLLTLQIFGVPHSAWEFVSLLASLVLVITAYVSIFKPYLGARIALIASLAAWCFYAPSTVATIVKGSLLQVSQFRVLALPYLAVGLLALATVYSAIVSFRPIKSGQSSTWLFPDGRRRASRIGMVVCSVAAIACLSVWFAFGAKEPQRPSSRFLIPDGYVGWVRIEFQVVGAPPTPVERNQSVFRIPLEGTLRTSSPERFGWSWGEYFYFSEDGLRALPADNDANRMIWGKINGEQSGSSGLHQYEEFFVGTKEQFKDWAGAKQVVQPPTGTTPN